MPFGTRALNPGPGDAENPACVTFPGHDMTVLKVGAAVAAGPTTSIQDPPRSAPAAEALEPSDPRLRAVH